MKQFVLSTVVVGLLYASQVMTANSSSIPLEPVRRGLASDGLNPVLESKSKSQKGDKSVKADKKHRDHKAS